MFERYTEKARRVIFFARYEAGVAVADHPVFEILQQHGISYEMARAKLFEETGGEVGA